MPESLELAEAEAALAAALTPLRNVMVAIEKEIGQREAELIALRKRRTETSRALAALDPQWAAEHRKPSTKKKGERTRPLTDLIGAERLDELHEYLRARFNGEVFTTPEIKKRSDWMGWNSSQLSAGLRLLQEQGRLRLDSKYGNVNHWALTS